MEDLLNTPLRVLRTLDDEALVQLARAVPAWTIPTVVHLDVVLAERVIDALLSGDPDTLDACDRLLRCVVLPSSRPALGHWMDRWHGWADLLMAREGQLANHDVEAVKRRPHVDAILITVHNEPGLSPTKLQERVGLNGAHLARLLTVMVDHGLVERRMGSLYPVDAG